MYTARIQPAYVYLNRLTVNSWSTLMVKSQIVMFYAFFDAVLMKVLAAHAVESHGFDAGIQFFEVDEAGIADRLGSSLQGGSGERACAT